MVCGCGQKEKATAQARSCLFYLVQQDLRGLTRSAAAEAAACYGKCVENALACVVQPASAGFP